MSANETPSIVVPQTVFDVVGTAGKTVYSRNPNAIGINMIAIQEEVVFDADDEIALDQILPAGAKVVGYVLNPKTTFAFTTATHLALGDGSDVDHFFELAKTGFDTKNEQAKAWFTTPIAVTADTTLTLTTTDGSDSKAGSASGTIQIIILAEVLPTIEAAS